MMISKQV